MSKRRIVYLAYYYYVKGVKCVTSQLFYYTVKDEKRKPKVIILKHLFDAIHDGGGVPARRDINVAVIYFDSVVIAKKQKAVVETRREQNKQNDCFIFIFFFFLHQKYCRHHVLRPPPPRSRFSERLPPSPARVNFRLAGSPFPASRTECPTRLRPTPSEDRGNKSRLPATSLLNTRVGPEPWRGVYVSRRPLRRADSISFRGGVSRSACRLTLPDETTKPAERLRWTGTAPLLSRSLYYTIPSPRPIPRATFTRH